MFGIKMYLATAAVMAFVLAMQADFPALRRWRFISGYFTIVVVLSEKVTACLTVQILQAAESTLLRIMRLPAAHSSV